MMFDRIDFTAEWRQMIIDTIHILLEAGSTIDGPDGEGPGPNCASPVDHLLNVISKIRHKTSRTLSKVHIESTQCIFISAQIQLIHTYGTQRTWRELYMNLICTASYNAYVFEKYQDGSVCLDSFNSIMDSFANIMLFFFFFTATYSLYTLFYSVSNVMS